MNLTYDYAKSGEIALDFIKAKYYELCFINYDLINKDPTLLKKLRETSLQDIFITIFSAYYLLHTIESIQADGANLVLTKPFFKSTLFDAFIALSTENHLNESTPHHSFNFSGHCVLDVYKRQLLQLPLHPLWHELHDFDSDNPHAPNISHFHRSQKRRLNSSIP